MVGSGTGDAIAYAQWKYKVSKDGQVWYHWKE